jgi:hypothetical protein
MNTRTRSGCVPPARGRSVGRGTSSSRQVSGLQTPASRPLGPRHRYRTSAPPGNRPAAATAGAPGWSWSRRRRGNGQMQIVPSTSPPDLRPLDRSGRCACGGRCVCAVTHGVCPDERACRETSKLRLEAEWGATHALAQGQCRTTGPYSHRDLGRGWSKVTGATVIVALPTTFCGRTR